MSTDYPGAPTPQTLALRRSLDALEESLRSDGRLSSPPPAPRRGPEPPEPAAKELSALENRLLRNHNVMSLLSLEDVTPFRLRQILGMARRAAK